MYYNENLPPDPTRLIDTLKAVAVCILGVAFIYATTAFVMLEGDFRAWPEIARLAFAITSILFVYVVIITVSEDDDDDDGEDDDNDDGEE